jgi:enhancing lycopene biosynthesis protein 2
MAKKVGVLLSGCGVYDGAEIHESVLTLLALDRAGAQAVCMAPDMEQLHVMNHYSQTEGDEKRNVLVESARIARGDIQNLADVNASQMDALIIPGGFGAAKNLSDFAVKGPDATVHPEVQRVVGEMLDAGKPVGALCIAPATLVRAVAAKSPEVTIGNDAGTAAAIGKMGGVHIDCAVDQVHVDQKNKIVTTPAYMLGPGIKDVAVGIEKLVNQVLALCG